MTFILLGDRGTRTCVCVCVCVCERVRVIQHAQPAGAMPCNVELIAYSYYNVHYESTRTRRVCELS